jgi:cell division protein FtsL
MILRRLAALSALGAIAAAFALYAVKHDTRQLDQRVQANERALEKAQSDIAVLKAELGYLTRPERLEPLARARGLEPASARQFWRLDAAPKPERGRP